MFWSYLRSSKDINYSTYQNILLRHCYPCSLQCHHNANQMACMATLDYNLYDQCGMYRMYIEMHPSGTEVYNQMRKMLKATCWDWYYVYAITIIYWLEIQWERQVGLYHYTAVFEGCSLPWQYRVQSCYCCWTFVLDHAKQMIMQHIQDICNRMAWLWIWEI